MTEVLTVSRATIESLPSWYRALATVMQEKGKLVVRDESQGTQRTPGP